jgi:DHA1 family tetracycline resistance protein-like MFS transporter
MRFKRARQPGLGFIFITLILLVLGFGIIIPILPSLVTKLEGGSIANSSGYYGSLVGVFALMQFVASPILGSLSDRFGRRKVILIALAGTAVDYVIMGLAPTIGWLFVARIISGATAGALATCNAYIADVTPPERRAQAFGLVGVAFGIGFAVGPLIGGWVSTYGHGLPFNADGLRMPFYVAALFVALNWLYGAFMLPESLPPERRRAFSWKRANPVGSLFVLGKFRGVLDLACMHFIYMLANVMLQSIWVLYAAERYHWGPLDVGLSLGLVGLMAIFVQGVLIRRIIARLKEKRGLAFGLGLSALVMTGYGLSTRGWMIYLLIPIGAFGGIAGPAAQALITRHVPHDQQGAIQGSLSGLTSLASIFAPLIATRSFGYFISNAGPLYLPGIAFFEAALLMLVALALAFRAFRRYGAEEDSPDVEPSIERSAGT